MPDVKVQQKQALSRQEAARFIAALAEGLRDDGKVTVRLGSSSLELSVASHVDCELEVAVDGDEIELELELKWSTSGRAPADVTEDESVEDQSAEDESEKVQPEPVSGENDAEEPEIRRDASAEEKPRPVNLRKTPPNLATPRRLRGMTRTGPRSGAAVVAAHLRGPASRLSTASTPPLCGRGPRPTA